MGLPRTHKVFIAILWLLSGSLIQRAGGQVVADFTINVPVSNCNPAVYSFTNNSTGTGLLTYQWNFGVYPGINSVFENPSTTYLTCGSFSVKLIVTNSLGQKDSVTKAVTVRCSPRPNFTVNDVAGCAPMPVKFVSTSLPGSGTITDYVWDFGDGSTGTGLSEDYTYNTSGCKNVTLIVTNSFGCVKDTTINNVLCAHPSPTANFSSPVTTTCNIPLTVDYSNLTSGGTGPFTYKWVFEGGSPPISTLATPHVVYNSFGSFTTSLIVVDANGCSDTLELQNYINTLSSTANFTVSGTACENGSITASASPASNPLTYQWTVTPSASISAPASKNTSVAFTDTGSYNLCLRINYANNCAGNRCTTIVVRPTPKPLFGASGQMYTCAKPNSIVFTDSSTGTGLTYSWSFTGGVPSTSALKTPPTVVYNNCGTYTAGLTVRNSFNCASTYTLPNFSTVTCPQNSFTIGPRYGCIPLTAGFISHLDIDTPVAWHWDFGDTASGPDNFSTEKHPQHTYANSGCYTVILTTTTSSGCIVKDTVLDAVCCGQMPHPNFSANPPVNCANQPVYFTDSSTGTYEYTTYIWDFFGGEPYDDMSNERNPQFIYHDTGTLDITLIVSNYGCADTITKDDYIKILAPLADPKVIIDCHNGSQVTLDGSGSMGAQRYKWIMPGGTPSEDSTPVVTVTYATPGVYAATLIVYNDSTGCSDLGDRSYRVSSLSTSFTATPLQGCVPLKVCMNNTSTNAASYQWQIIHNNGTVIDSSSAMNPCFTLNAASKYDVRLITTDARGCVDTLSKPNYILANKVFSDFAGSPLTGCAPLTSNFTSRGNSTVSSLAPIVSWRWTFGDPASGSQNISTLKNPSHVFNDTGYYNIHHYVEDNLGCFHSITKPLYVKVTKPNAYFESLDTLVCRGSNVCFTNQSGNGSQSYQWLFGDGTTSTLLNPCHTFADSGSYNVSLIARDNSGCRDTFTRGSYIQVDKMTVDFSANVTLSTCPPLLVRFTNNSYNIPPGTSYLWDFGDGQVSSLVNPVHIYNAPGLFDVKLIATSPGGCTDTIIKNDYIVIGGPALSVTEAPSSGCAPHYTCMSVNSPTAISYTWNLGDGTVIQDGTDSICYTYERSGSFYPELIVADAAGCIFSKPMGVVHIGGAFSYFKNIPEHICGSQRVQFIDSSYGVSPIQSISWDFGDPASGSSNTSAVLSPAHYFSTSGSFKVTEYINTVDGCSNSSEKIIDIHPAMSLLVGISDSNTCGPDTIQFSDKTNHPVPYNFLLWNFGDPASGNENYSGLPAPSHYYSLPGTYQISLVAVDTNGCSDTAFTNFISHADVKAAFTATDTCLNTPPIYFQNTSIGAGHYDWAFGDGASSSLTQPSHAYSDSGTYTVQLIASNKFCRDTAQTSVTIYPLPDASFQLNTKFLCGPPATFTPINTSTGAGFYIWNFGTGSTSNAVNPTYTYPQSGSFGISLSARNQFGCSDIFIDSITIYPYPKTNHIYLEPLEGCVPFTATFTADVTNGNLYTWDFGDSSAPVVTTHPTITHTYSDTGVFSVKLNTISYMDCGDSVTLHDTVKVHVIPVAAFDYTINTIGDIVDGTVVFSNQSHNATTYFWEFGDGFTSGDKDPSHLYTEMKDFQAILYVESEFGCRDSVSASFFVVKKSLYVPNAFSPDYKGGEALVNIWQPVGIGLLEYHAAIYNTWGELLWESNRIDKETRPAEGWDGTYRGQPCHQDVYVWKIEAKFLDGTPWQGMSYKEGQPRKTMGDVTLIR